MTTPLNNNQSASGSLRTIRGPLNDNPGPLIDNQGPLTNDQGAPNRQPGGSLLANRGPRAPNWQPEPLTNNQETPGTLTDNHGPQDT